MNSYKFGHLKSAESIIPMGFGFENKYFNTEQYSIKTIVLDPTTRTSLRWYNNSDIFVLIIKGSAAIIVVNTEKGQEDCQHILKDEYCLIKSNTMYQICNASEEKQLVVLEINIGDGKKYFYKMGDDIDPLVEKNKEE